MPGKKRSFSPSLDDTFNDTSMRCNDEQSAGGGSPDDFFDDTFLDAKPPRMAKSVSFYCF